MGLQACRNLTDLRAEPDVRYSCSKGWLSKLRPFHHNLRALTTEYQDHHSGRFFLTAAEQRVDVARSEVSVSWYFCEPKSGNLRSIINLSKQKLWQTYKDCGVGSSRCKDCDVGFDNWRLGWSRLKQKWC